MMHKMSFAIAAIAAPLLMAAGPAEDEAAAAEAAKKQQAEAGDADRNVMVCKKFPPPTGSRAARKRQICKSKAEWDMINQDKDDELDRVQRDVRPF